MSKIVEDFHKGDNWLTYWLGNLLTVSEESMRSLFAWVVGCTVGGVWTWSPQKCGDQSLFYNGAFFIRMTWPLGIFWTVRWSGATDRKAMIQGSMGMKMNGRFTCGVGVILVPILSAIAWFEYLPWWAWIPALPFLFALRIQSDKTSAQGMSGANTGQSPGWEFGTH